jgi:SAM-dependent methyltransferase
LLAGCDVLEIGLGYGLVAQKLVEAGARYVGLDIASGSVAVARKRFALHGLQGTALQGSVLDLPFRDESFDAVVTIGCLHHTGDLKAGVDEVYRVLRPGGRALVMVYNAFSYRRWLRWPLATLRQLRSERSGEGTIAVASTRERRIYDPDSAGGGAPETVFTSVRQLARLCSRFRSCRIRKENAAREHVFRFVPRPLLLPIMGPTLGLDLYAQLTK